MTSSPDRLRILLVGAGRIALSHLASIDTNPAVRLVAVIDPDLRAARRVAAPHDAEVFADLDEALDRVSADAAIIVSPTKTHVDVTARCLRAGLHAMVEKPVATSTGELLDLISIAEGLGRIVTAAQVVRFLPTTACARQIIADGGVGDVEQVIQRRLEYRHVIPDWWRETDDFLLGHWGSHSIDLVLDLLEEPIDQVDCRAGRRLPGFGGIDNVNLLATMAGGGRMSLNMSMSSRRTQHDLVIIGSAGTLELIGYSDVLHNGDTVFSLPESDVLAAGFRAQLDDFLFACRGRATRASARSTLSCHDVLDAASRSIARGTVERVARSIEIG